MADGCAKCHIVSRFLRHAVIGSREKRLVTLMKRLVISLFLFLFLFWWHFFDGNKIQKLSKYKNTLHFITGFNFSLGFFWSRIVVCNNSAKMRKARPSCSSSSAALTYYISRWIRQRSLISSLVAFKAKEPFYSSSPPVCRGADR